MTAQVEDKMVASQRTIRKNINMAFIRYIYESRLASCLQINVNNLTRIPTVPYHGIVPVSGRPTTSHSRLFASPSRPSVIHHHSQIN